MFPHCVGVVGTEVKQTNVECSQVPGARQMLLQTVGNLVPVAVTKNEEKEKRAKKTYLG